LGIYHLDLRLMPEVVASFALAVVNEGEGWAEAEARAAQAAETPTETPTGEDAA
jgi:hypothetical protein